jgi:hypothetical protein
MTLLCIARTRARGTRVRAARLGVRGGCGGQTLRQSLRLAKMDERTHSLSACDSTGGLSRWPA